jgi:hypothetical protein
MIDNLSVMKGRDEVSPIEKGVETATYRPNNNNAMNL